MSTAIRTDLNGLRVQLPGDSRVYLVDQGRIRHIPNPLVYNALFRDVGGIVPDININEIATGEPVPETAILFRTTDNPKVWLLDGVPPHQVKRWITSPAAMDRYHFNWNTIHVYNIPSAGLLYPDGPEISWR